MKLLHIVEAGSRLSMFVICLLFCSCEMFVADNVGNEYLSTVKFDFAGPTNITFSEDKALAFNFYIPGDVCVNRDSLKCMFNDSEKPFYLKRNHYFCYVGAVDKEGKKGLTIGIAKDFIFSRYSKEKKDVRKVKFYILPCSFLVKDNDNVLTDTIKVSMEEHL